MRSDTVSLVFGIDGFFGGASSGLVVAALKAASAACRGSWLLRDRSFMRSPDAGTRPGFLHIDGRIPIGRAPSGAVRVAFRPGVRDTPAQQYMRGCSPMTTTVEVLATAFKEAGTPFIVGHP